MLRRQQAPHPAAQRLRGAGALPGRARRRALPCPARASRSRRLPHRSRPKVNMHGRRRWYAAVAAVRRPVGVIRRHGDCDRMTGSSARVSNRNRRRQLARGRRPAAVVASSREATAAAAARRPPPPSSAPMRRGRRRVRMRRDCPLAARLTVTALPSGRLGGTRAASCSAGLLKMRRARQLRHQRIGDDGGDGHGPPPSAELPLPTSCVTDSRDESEPTVTVAMTWPTSCEPITKSSRRVQLSQHLLPRALDNAEAGLKSTSLTINCDPIAKNSRRIQLSQL